MATENKALYDAVTCVLSCALQADSEIQRLAEERKKALEMVDGELNIPLIYGFWGLIDHRIYPMLKSENEEHVYNAVFFLKHCMNFDEYKTGIPFKTSPEYFEILLTIFQKILGPTKHCHIITNSLPAIGQLMTSCCDQFKEIVKQTSRIPKDSSEDMDEESTNFIDLINLIIGLIKNMVFSMYFDLLLEDLDNLVYCLFIFMCCYDEMEEELFLEDSEKTKIFPIRSNASEILTHIRFRVTRGRRRGPEIFYKSIHNVFHKLMEEVQLVNTNRQLYHARVTESLMFGLGYMNYSPQIDVVFPHRFYLDNWTAHMQQESNSTVNGRLLWLGGIFSHVLSPNTLSIHLKAIIQNLRGESRYLYVPSTEALRNHMRQEECSFAYIHSMQETLITTIYTHLSNVSIMKEVSFILGNISMKESLQEALHLTMIPFLCKILHGDMPEQLQGRKDAPERALELLTTIATYTTQPNSEALIIQGFSGAANLMLDTEQEDDSNLNEAAANFITTLIVKMGSQVNYLRNSKNVPLTEYIPKIILECIDSMKNISGLQVGKLCIVSIVTLPDVMEPHFESILKSVLSAIQVDNSFEKIRGLWLIFIYIFMCRPVNTTNFLSSIPGPDGGSALNFLINMWQPEYVSLITKFERTVLSMALVQVITFSLEATEDKLMEIEVHLSAVNRNPSTMSGLEYLYLLLIFVVLMEHALNEDIAEHCFDLVVEDEDGRNEEDNMILNYSPLNIDIVAFVTQFLKHENVYYLNVCRNYLYHEEIIRLSNMGCTVPQVSME
ncbi:hypothetical protein NQ314_001452 [Rhamnusium bicolor]|uniref:Uncharacterized protein n=1 Tax=Rhamnusium bicolor TaxID=1586634 RepID=A0AAV8ZRT5_9CUCU|nr:hypothetical protein NQ314_001452 [Rhamnusium bicolor]